MVRIGRKMFKGLIDTGSMATILNHRVAQKLKLSFEDANDTKTLFSANGTPIPVLATAEIVLSFAGLQIPHTVKIVKDVEYDLILGADFLSQNKVIIDYQTKLISIGDDLVRMPLQSRQDDANCARAMRTLCIPAYSEMLIPLKTPARFNNKTIMLEPLSCFQFSNFAAARSISSCKNGKTVGRILNYNPTALVLRRRTRIMAINSTDDIDTCVPFVDAKATPAQTDTCSNLTRSMLDEFHEQYGFKISPEITEDQKYELLQLLYQYKHAFARSLSEIGQYPNYELELDTMSNRKIYTRQFRLHPDDAKVAQQQIDEMRDLDIIEPAQDADFNSPIFLVAKRDGSKRLICDLRGPNSQIIPRTVNVPKINELIDTIMMTKSKFYSVVDLRAGFWQIKIAPNSRPLTAFTAPNGLRFMYKVTPFGLNNSPAAMLTVLMTIFAGKTSSIQLYMDDIICLGNSWENHLETVREMLQTLSDNHLTCNPSKCEFAFSEIEFLGFKLTENGVKISEKKIKAVKSIVAPTTKKSLQRLLGLFQFFRRYIRNFSQKTANMRKLLIKDAKFEWSEACQEELDYLKNSLIQDPILKAVDPNKDFVLNTDASCTGGYSYVLMQYGDDQNLHVVAYGAQAVTRAQSNYTIAELELIAVALALKEYEPFVIHRHITVVTDNSRVLHLDKWPVVNSRQKRLLTYLMQFRLTVRYVRGSKNYTADALSRIFEDMTDVQKQEFLPAPSSEEFIVATRTSDKVDEDKSGDDEDSGIDIEQLTQIRPITEADYEGDEEFQDIFRYLASGQLKGDDKVDKVTLLLADQYFLEGGLLFRLTTPRGKKEFRVSPVKERLCVPKQYRFDLMNYFHSNLGHFGVQRLFLSLSQRVYWRSLFTDVCQFCKTCDICLRSKRNFNAKLPPLNPLETPSRCFQFWAMDHKPLCRTTVEGNTAILCCVDMFSNWPVLIPVKDLSAETTAKAFFRHVVAVYGVPERIMSDRSKSFCGSFFAYLTKLLGVNHRMSSATTARANGQAEALVQRLSQMVKIYAKDDTKIEEAIPVIEMALRSSTSARLGLSPFHIVFGREMTVADPSMVEETTSFSGDYKQYYEWLKGHLQFLHKAIKQNRIETKEEEKRQYDRRHSTAIPDFKIGDEVLLYDDRVRPHSNTVLTHRKYNGPYFIVDLVQGSPEIGQVYRLIHAQTGKSYKTLVPASRLKKYTADRTDLLARLPSNIMDPEMSKKESIDEGAQDSSLGEQQDEELAGYCPAKRILKERTRNKQKEYLVLFMDGSKAWADAVTPTLLQHYRVLQEKRRQRRRNKKTSRSKQ